MTDEERTGIPGFCVLELLGHRRLGGFVQEQEIAGAGLLRIDIPAETGTITQFYSPQALYALTLCSEDVARQIAAQMPQPVSVWDVKALLPEITETVKREIEDEVRREYYATLDAQQKRRTLTGTGANYDADEDEEMPL